MPEYTLQPGQTVLDVLTAAGLVASKSDGRRMIEQKGVKLDGEILEQVRRILPPSRGAAGWQETVYKSEMTE